MKPPRARAPKINQFGHRRVHTNVTVSRYFCVMGVTLLHHAADATKSLIWSHEKLQYRCHEIIVDLGDDLDDGLMMYNAMNRKPV